MDSVSFKLAYKLLLGGYGIYLGMHDSPVWGFILLALAMFY